MRLLRTRREKALTLVAAGVAVLWALTEAYQSGFAAPREALAREERTLESELDRLTRLHGRSQEIRARYEALPSADRDRKEAPAEPADVLPLLEELARGKVTLVEVHPEERAGGGRAASVSLEFRGGREAVGDFLEGMILDLRGSVRAFDAAVDPEGVVRCQAKIAFPGPSAAGGGSS